MENLFLSLLAFQPLSVGRAETSGLWDLRPSAMRKTVMPTAWVVWKPMCGNQDGGLGRIIRSSCLLGASSQTALFILMCYKIRLLIRSYKTVVQNYDILGVEGS